MYLCCLASVYSLLKWTFQGIQLVSGSDTRSIYFPGDQTSFITRYTLMPQMATKAPWQQQTFYEQDSREKQGSVFLKKK